MKSDDGGIEAPKSFATLVTNNYEVMAHYKDRSPNYSLDNIATETHNTEKWLFWDFV